MTNLASYSLSEIAGAIAENCDIPVTVARSMLDKAINRIGGDKTDEIKITD